MSTRPTYGVDLSALWDDGRRCPSGTPACTSNSMRNVPSRPSTWYLESKSLTLATLPISVAGRATVPPCSPAAGRRRASLVSTTRRRCWIARDRNGRYPLDSRRHCPLASGKPVRPGIHQRCAPVGSGSCAPAARLLKCVRPGGAFAMQIPIICTPRTPDHRGDCRRFGSLRQVFEILSPGEYYDLSPLTPTCSHLDHRVRPCYGEHVGHCTLDAGDGFATLSRAAGRSRESRFLQAFERTVAEQYPLQRMGGCSSHSRGCLRLPTPEAIPK